MKKTKSEKSAGIVPGTIIIIAVLIIAFGLVFAWMYSVDLLFLPDFVKDFFGITDDEASVTWNIGELQSAVKNGRNQGNTAVSFDVTYDNIKNAFLGGEIPEGEFVDGKVTVYENDTYHSKKILVYRCNEKYRAEIGGYDQHTTATYAVSDGKTVTFKDTENGELTTKNHTAGISFENEIGIPSLSDIIAIVERFPKDNNHLESSTEESEQDDTQAAPEDGLDIASSVPEADPDDITDCEICLLRTENGNVYYVAFTWEAQGIREEYYLSLDYRTVIYAETSVNGATVYTYEALQISYDRTVYGTESLYKLS